MPSEDQIADRPSPGPAMGRAFASRNFRLYFGGQGMSLIGTWMTRLATGWLVFRIGGASAPWLLGAVSFAGLAPTFFLAPLAGVFVDRWDRHRVLVATQVLSMLQSAALALVAFRAEAGAAAVALIAALAVVQGIINAFDMPARQSLLIDMVERREDLPNAIALNSSLVNGSRLVGPALAGAVIAAVGEAWCFAIDAISYLAVIAALRAMRLPRRPRRDGDASVRRHLVEGARYAFGFPPIRALLLLLALVSFATMPQSALLPIFAADVFGGGPYTLGLLSMATGLGALGAALYLASRTSVLGLGRVIVAAAVALGIGLVGFSVAGSIWLAAPLIAVSGAGIMIQLASTNTLIQTMVDEDKRGRVMGFYGMAFQGAAPFGSLLGGWLAGVLGVRLVVAGSGVLVLCGAALFCSQLPRLRRHTRPVYVRLGILPPAAQAATTPPALGEPA
ncbi:enterobactin exporter EntS [Aquisphaera giovannonii]|uniref:Enterobactin exporter EntS n=1 Tax=Aquisphaera giovannonii TaxID=406548 RepID=A0A5B9WBB4_9BACT|nr:MFS transporter [Aquisphaera giovannonii]QEH37544.1 enterobactin exporter EntS [Aquisphaera giovannonii]